MIRQATVDDLPRLLELCETFWNISPWAKMGLERDDVAICENLERAIEIGSCFIGERGLIFGFIGPLWASPANKVAVEFAWFGPGEGRQLREAFEGWAKEQGCFGVQMATLGAAWDDDTAAGLRSAGYRLAEQGYFKRVTP